MLGADPFVIALTKVNGYTVITEETGIGSLGKIPGVCAAMKVALCCSTMFTISPTTIGILARVFPVFETDPTTAP
ncbi:DUF4411 family protein [Bradyrhizobium iriomotense]|uniref:DUF4411 family protein n=1 Tax=Bradyrhizobium iriomotense TaxID=441950 RepID=UPI0024E162CA|nr:DUF4411 family protein [Bradyrhizobium iriomotense]